MLAKQQAEKLLAKAGVTINGPNDFDVQVFNEKLYPRVMAGGALALGESYMDGWWDAKSLDGFLYKLLTADLYDEFMFSWPMLASLAVYVLFDKSRRNRAFQIGKKHYDIGNDVYEAMLDPSLTYTCGYWKNAASLQEAQMAKLDLTARKIGLKKGDSVLDIGCGWGSFLRLAAEKYGASGTGITVSRNQVELARKMCEGMPIEIKLEDYRNTKGNFNHIISLGMFEHVGVKNHRAYMKKAHEVLKDGGVFLLHTIGINSGVYPPDPWIEKYIFPNSKMPTIAHIGNAIDGLFVMEDWHNFGADYDKTLMAWFENFDRAWPQLKAKYGDPPSRKASGRQGRFYRMWKYYLLSCAANFRSRGIELWQIVLSKKGVRGGYTSIR